jgi:hypothetical protein
MVISVVELTRNCVSGSDFGKVWVPVPVISAPVQASENIYHSFKKCTKSCLFNVRSHIVSHKGGLTFFFLLFSHFMLDPHPNPVPVPELDPNPNPVPEPECIPVMVPLMQKVPVPGVPLT